MKVQILSRDDPGRGRKVDAGIKIIEPPRNGRHNFRKDWLDRVKAFCSITTEAITLHTVDGDVRFNIDQQPGTRKCLATGNILPPASADPTGEQARSAIAALGDTAVKTERWPSGYSVCPPGVYFTTMEAK